MAAEFAAEAAERRRIRRASNPRASFAYVATAIGLAVVAGAVVWLLSQNPDVVTAGLALFSAALVLALGMVVAGVARRRSGFLAFVTVIALVAALITGGAATLGDVRFGSTSVWNSEGSNSIRQPFGTTMIQLQNLPSLASPPVTVHKGSGYTEIYVGDGVKLQLTATVRDVRVQWQRIDLSADGDTIGTEDGSYSGSRQADGSTVYRETVTTPLDPNRPADDPDVPQTVVSVPVTIDQDSGQIRVLYLTRPDQEKPE
ncbi:hypothetical protein [Microbacterium suwonense]|uniref:Uncharacterized protein n=2 Tax=Microbacterium suwonense TaxID=683047 RepID=A0ABN6X6V6_9MICO|nr:hypothetical protein [Microbacterium suwonense]BDZ40535.1 hypothetical protein GCM10025863_31490 [Microbacterium suwonense]